MGLKLLLPVKLGQETALWGRGVALSRGGRIYNVEQTWRPPSVLSGVFTVVPKRFKKFPAWGIHDPPVVCREGLQNSITVQLYKYQLYLLLIYFLLINYLNQIYS